MKQSYLIAVVILTFVVANTSSAELIFTTEVVPTVGLPGVNTFRITATSDLGNIAGFDFTKVGSYGITGSLNQVAPFGQPTFFPNAALSYASYDPSQDTQFLVDPNDVLSIHMEESSDSLHGAFAFIGNLQRTVGNSLPFLQIATSDPTSVSLAGTLLIRRSNDALLEVPFDLNLSDMPIGPAPIRSLLPIPEPVQAPVEAPTPPFEAPPLVTPLPEPIIETPALPIDPPSIPQEPSTDPIESIEPPGAAPEQPDTVPEPPAPAPELPSTIDEVLSPPGIAFFPIIDLVLTDWEPPVSIDYLTRGGDFDFDGLRLLDFNPIVPEAYSTTGIVSFHAADFGTTTIDAAPWARTNGAAFRFSESLADATTAPIPEPMSSLLFLIGAAYLAAFRRQGAE